MKRNLIPGNIAIANLEHTPFFTHRIPVYGIILPKHEFVELYKEEHEGKWINEMFKDGIGTLEDAIMNSNFPHEQEKEDRYKYKFLGPESFLENGKLIGVKTFGEMYSPTAKRVLDLEIFDTIEARSYELRYLGMINSLRMYSFMESGGIPVGFDDVSSDIDAVIKYFDGSLIGKKDDEKNERVKEWEKTLKRCNFNEGDVEFLY